MTVRVRYAPSPTGEPHVGNVRTALWSWLHARRHGGVFFVRIEDTDQTRLVPGSQERILESLRWLGMDWDEGPDIGGPFAPYTQSERLPLYQAAAAALLESGNAYRCFCTPERLEELRNSQRENHMPPGYDGRCRSLLPDEAEARAVTGEPNVVRFLVPDEGSTTFTDLIRGDITVENVTMDDFVILKSDGFPTYHLAHAVDDHAMEVTHVSRGDEWIPSAPRHVLLFRALGYEPPIYVHTSIILAPGGGKLSKRHGAKAILEYRDDGFLPEALFNFLAITGWAPDGTTEVMTKEQAAAVFDFDQLNAHPATFDMDKLEWLNGIYLRQMSVSELSERFAQQLERDLPPEVPRPLDRAFVEEITPLVQERVKLLPEVTPLVDFFFDSTLAAPARETLLGKPFRERPEAARAALDAALAALRPLELWEPAAVEAALRAAAETAGEKPGDLFMLCRVSVTGKSVTPPLFETMAIVGRETSLARLEAAAQLAAGT
ncbi:MAG: glutamate--tRNA ligase [Chloroflexota bacterium]